LSFEAGKILFLILHFEIGINNVLAALAACILRRPFAAL
jgi:hypothetical protein